MQEYLLYPVMGPGHDDLVRLALYLPQVAVVDFPGHPAYGLPGRLSEKVRPLAPALDSDVLDLFQRAEATYRDMAKVFGDPRTLANLKGQLWTDGPLEGEFQILESIRGGAKRLTKDARDIIESLVFMKLAGEYDLAQSEVDRDLAGLTTLEEMLRESLGSDAEIPEPDPTPPVFDDDILVPPRFRAYLRLLRLVEGAERAALLVSSRDIYHSALIAAAGAELPGEEPKSIIITTLPDPAELGPENLERFLYNAEQRGALKRFHDAVEGVAGSLADKGEPDQEALDLAAAISGEIATLPPLASVRREIALAAATLPFSDPVGLLMHLFLREKPPDTAGRSVFVSLGPAPARNINPFGPRAL